MHTPRIVILGTGTCSLNPNRAASSCLIELPTIRLVYDLGRGVTTRLTQVGLRGAAIEHIVFSHYHPDHVSDLIPFLQASLWSPEDRRANDLHLYGPLGLVELVEKMMKLFVPDALAGEAYRLHLHEVSASHLEITGNTFEWRQLPHGNFQNHGLAFTYEGRRYALSGDMNFADVELEFLNQSECAVIDAGHITNDQIVEVAVRTGVGRLFCSHQYRELNSDALNGAAQARGYRGKIVIASDLMEITL